MTIVWKLTCMMGLMTVFNILPIKSISILYKTHPPIFDHLQSPNICNQTAVYTSVNDFVLGMHIG